MFEMHATHTRAAVREATFSAISTISGVFSQADNSLTPLYNLTTSSQYNRTIPQLSVPQLSVFPPSCPSYLSTDRRGVLVPLPLASFQQTPHKPTTQNRAAPVPSHTIPKVPDGEDGWKQVVRDWEYADPSRSLLVPLKDWPVDWYLRAACASTTLGSLRNQRKIIATEFIDVYAVFPLSLDVPDHVHFTGTDKTRHDSKPTIPCMQKVSQLFVWPY